MIINESVILEKLGNHRCNSVDQSLLSKTPDFSLYAFAPYWTVSQAFCLIMGIPVIDPETLSTILSLNPIFAEAYRLKGSVDENSNERIDFKEYVARKIVLPKNKLDYWKNIYQLFQRELKTQTVIKVSVEGAPRENLLVPQTVIEWAKRQKIFIAVELEKYIHERDLIDLRYFPKVFHNEYNLTALFSSMRIRQNLSWPGQSITPELLASALRARIASGYSFKREPLEDSSSLNTDFAEERESTIELSTKLENLYSRLSKEIRWIANKALQEIIQNEEEQKKHFNAVMNLCDLKRSELQKYSRGYNEKFIQDRLKSRALARLIHYYDNTLTVKEIASHHLLRKYVWEGKEPPYTLETIKKWVYKEHLHRRKVSSKDL